ncbi:MAG: class I SAM-dependent methyltransferase [Proteobacteria bacterium]|nr:class I SAM-dependent methyltransferase [Pseudomonadota bacterium]
MLSDGRCLDIPLEKTTCLQCGIAAHARPLTVASIRDVYGDDYALASASPLADAARARAYADALTRLVTPHRRILEIGCGSGALLRELHGRWLDASLTGLDPAVPESAGNGARIRYKRGFFEAFGEEKEEFDLIFSVNVIEHVADPGEFFARAAALLAPGGQMVFFCPTSEPPNLELLFHDHLHTFTPAALERLARAVGMTMQIQENRVEGLGDFQFISFVQSTRTVAQLSNVDPIKLAQQRTDYLLAWRNLEKILHARIGAVDRVALFGAGQMAALLRAYAPTLWERVDMLVMDNPGDAWSLDKPVRAYADVRDTLQDAVMVIATAPGAQGFVANRLVADGLKTVRFDDLISS